MIGWQLVADEDANADHDHVDQDADAHVDADQEGVRVLGDSTEEKGDRVAAGG